LRNEEHAWQLLYLIDSIHKWAITTYRPFIQRHLRTWHEAVERDFLFEWDQTTRGEVGEKRKRYEKRRLDISRRKLIGDGALLINPYFCEPEKIRLPVWAK
jgi:hypothetical protein